MTIHRRAVTRASFTAVGAVAAGLLLTGTAAAHVTIRPDVDTAGSYSKITVRVPNESDTAGTTQVRLELPADSPFASVRVQPHPGWTAEVTRTQFPEPVEVGDRVLEDAVTAITWTAEPGVRIAPDEFDEFAISVGPLPEAGTYYLPATQTYEDGDVVAWAEEPAEDGAEPERPAPELTVVAADESADGDDAHGVSDTDDGSHDGSDDSASDHETSASSGGDDSDGLAIGLGVGGIVLGAAGLGVGAAALRKRNA